MDNICHIGIDSLSCRISKRHTVVTWKSQSASGRANTCAKELTNFALNIKVKGHNWLVATMTNSMHNNDVKERVVKVYIKIVFKQGEK